MVVSRENNEMKDADKAVQEFKCRQLASGESQNAMMFLCFGIVVDCVSPSFWSHFWQVSGPIDRHGLSYRQLRTTPRSNSFFHLHVARSCAKRLTMLPILYDKATRPTIPNCTTVQCTLNTRFNDSISTYKPKKSTYKSDHSQQSTCHSFCSPLLLSKVGKDSSFLGR